MNQNPAALLIRSLREDVAAAVFRWPVNSVAGSPLVPRAVRFLIYRAAGLDIRTANIYPGCIFVARQVTIGPDTFVNRGCLLEGAARLTIGRDCQIAMGAMFLTSTHPWTPDGSFAHLPQNRPTTVGDRCWIGARAIILPGVTVGDGCVVGAGAVVTRDCEPGYLYAGNPARQIRCLTALPHKERVS
jgi:maltose O-acetyltransferase